MRKYNETSFKLFINTAIRFNNSMCQLFLQERLREEIQELVGLSRNSIKLSYKLELLFISTTHHILVYTKLSEFYLRMINHLLRIQCTR